MLNITHLSFTCRVDAMTEFEVFTVKACCRLRQVTIETMALVHRKSRGRRQGKLRATSDPTYESRIQAAIQGLTEKTYKSISAAAKDQNVSRSKLTGKFNFICVLSGGTSNSQ